jgi:hypothetical protein
MPKQLYVVDLTPAERADLLGLLKRGSAPARRLTRARVLLLADEDRTDEDISEALHTSRPTVERLRKRFVDGGLERALGDRLAPVPRGGSPAATRPCWWRWRAATRPRDGYAGCGNCSPTAW